MLNLYCPECGKNVTRTALTGMIIEWVEEPISHLLVDIGHHKGCYKLSCYEQIRIEKEKPVLAEEKVDGTE